MAAAGGAFVNQRKTAGFATSQCRALLVDLSNSNHAVRTKAVKKFEEYITQYKPEVYDDDVESLFLGSNEWGSNAKVGLLHWAGLDSGKHGGQLKRICAPVIALIRWLITFDFGNGAENIFYERFMHVSTEELAKINFTKHILGETDGKGAIKIMTGQTRAGGGDDALEILSLLMRDHRTPDGDSDPLDVGLLLGDNKPCRDRLAQYLQRTTAEHVRRVE